MYLTYSANRRRRRQRRQSLLAPCSAPTRDPDAWRPTPSCHSADRWQTLLVAKADRQLIILKSVYTMKEYYERICLDELDLMAALLALLLAQRIEEVVDHLERDVAEEVSRLEHGRRRRRTMTARVAVVGRRGRGAH